VNFTASYHGPVDFVRRPSSAKAHRLHIFASRYCTANRISIWCPSELAVRVALNASEIALRLESSYQ
jgi:hypothetical protein